MSRQTAWDVPPLRRPFLLRGNRDVGVVLDEFAPTQLDAWTGRAAFPLATTTGVPGAVPDTGPVAGTVVARAVVVRHGGDVEGRPPRFGARRRQLDALLDANPGAEPLVGIVLEEAGVTLAWVRGDAGEVAAALSRADWRMRAG